MTADQRGAIRLVVLFIRAGILLWCAWERWWFAVVALALWQMLDLQLDVWAVRRRLDARSTTDQASETEIAEFNTYMDAQRWPLNRLASSNSTISRN